MKNECYITFVIVSAPKRPLLNLFVSCLDLESTLISLDGFSISLHPNLPQKPFAPFVANSYLAEDSSE